MTDTFALVANDLDWSWNRSYDKATAAVTTSDGTAYRARIERDPEPTSPSGWDSTAPMVYLDSGYAQSYQYADEVTRAWEHYYGTRRHDLLERFLRIHFGATVVTFGRVDGPEAVFFDTADWREMTGWQPGMPGNPATESRSEWQQWANGDVYGVTVERRHTGVTVWDNEVETAAERWDEIGMSCWDLYGQDYAREYAAQALNDAIGE